MSGEREAFGEEMGTGGEHPGAELSAFVDGELDDEATRRIRRHLEGCTECAREVALIRAMGNVMRESTGTTDASGIWEGVHRRLTRPAGWILVVSGVVVMATLAVLEWFRAGNLTLEWLATTAIAVGGGLLVVSIGYEQYREWKSSPYRDVER